MKKAKETRRKTHHRLSQKRPKAKLVEADRTNSLNRHKVMNFNKMMRPSRKILLRNLLGLERGQMRMMMVNKLTRIRRYPLWMAHYDTIVMPLTMRKNKLSPTKRRTQRMPLQMENSATQQMTKMKRSQEAEPISLLIPIDELTFC